jgi:hypothetical protein
VRLIQKQETIGWSWSHFLRTRLTTEWTVAQKTMAPGSNSRQIIALMTTNLLKIMYVMWKSWNDIQHGGNTQQIQQRKTLILIPRLQAIYGLAKRMSNTDRRCFEQLYQNVARLPYQQLEKWLQYNKKWAYKAVKRAKIQLV